MAKRKTATTRKRTYNTAGRRASASNKYRQVMAAVLFVVSIFLLISLMFSITGPAGEFVAGILKGLFGWSAFAIPLIFIYLAIGASAEGTKTEIMIRIWSGIITVVSLSVILHIFYYTEQNSTGDMYKVLENLYESGAKLNSGGVVGGLGIPLIMLFDKVGTGIIVGFILLVSFMLATGVTLYQIVKILFPFKFKELAGAVSNTFKKNSDDALTGDKPKGKQKEKIALDIPIDSNKDKPQINDIIDSLNTEEEEKAAVKAAKKSTLLPFTGNDGEGIQQAIYNYPPLILLGKDTQAPAVSNEAELRQSAQKLVDTLSSFGVDTKVINISRGPSVTRYELQPSAGVKVSRITNLADDIALNLAASAVRIEAPIPGKAAVGIEVPNANVTPTYLRSIITANDFKDAKSNLTVCLGKDISGNSIVTDLAKMPHLLIAGATGSGKSVCINTIIISLLYKANPDEVKLLLIDPKVVELGVYNGIPHLLIPVVTDPKKSAGALSWAVSEMLNRYKLFAENGARDWDSYNQKMKDDFKQGLPQIVIIIDELADLMMVSPTEVEDSICRLAQMARAAGIHLVIATQRPSVDVITGTIKANIPSRIAFAVSSQVDSRIILDIAGAEKLLGKGDMLYMPIGVSKAVRIQGCFVSNKEVESVIQFVKSNNSTEYDDSIVDQIETSATDREESFEDDDSDNLLPDAIECVIDAGQASVSLLQRRLKLGYARAARIVDEMEERGIVGAYEGSKPRKVLISRQQWQEMLLNRKD